MKKTISITNGKFRRYPKVLEYAMNKTWEELTQAVEGLYHNLNTLN